MNASGVGNGAFADDDPARKLGESVVFMNFPMVGIGGSGKMVPHPHNEYGRPLYYIRSSGGEMYFVPTGRIIYSVPGSTAWNLDVYHSYWHTW